MARLRFQVSVSLDGFVAGPNPSVEHPLGEGGMQLHEWAFALAAWRAPHGREGGEVNASTPVVQRALDNVGATIMGRNMFGGGTGPWAEPRWDGWWGEDPPFHHPVFVLTHHAREPLVDLQGGTSFTFVTDGIEAALEQAFAAAGGKDVSLGGGADVAQQCLAAGLLDDLELHVVPVLLGSGTRLFDRLAGVHPQLEQVDVVEAVAQQCLAAGLLDDLELHVVPVLLGSGTRLFDRLAGVHPQLEQVDVVEAPGVTHLRYRVAR